MMSFEVLERKHLAIAENATSPHPVVQLMLDRAMSGSQRGNRDDPHTIALAIEGGGIAGVVSAGMCVVLESAGLIDTVDRIYGTSSGSLNGSFTAAGQAALGATNYEDIANANFAKKSHLLHGKSIVNFDYLFNDVMGRKEPYDFKSLQRGPEFAAMTINLDSLEAMSLKDFQDTANLMQALRASCAMPVYSGRRPIMYQNTPMTDGALLAGVPFRAALDEGATHVLALRSRGEDYRKIKYPRRHIAVVRLVGGQALASLVAGRPKIYNEDADELQFGESPTLTQLVPAAGVPVEQMEKSLSKIRRGFQFGMIATGKAFGMPLLNVSWEDRPIILACTSTKKGA